MGVQRREYLYDLQFWELLLISRGYERRTRHLWSSIRWQTYNIMSAIPYTDLQKSGIHKATDLLRLPWDNENIEDRPISDEEQQEMQREMDALNELWSGKE